uniref:Uncharacterized protein n=1 Tax=Daphnia galeata TaxID=27404 RepID=A0A8J2S7V0_9CRUS|nr:unnamed protein product [Daphnia galeata]
MANPINQNFSLEIVKHVVCLKGTNFTSYKQNMNMIFRLKGLNGFVDGRVPKPEPIFAALPVVEAVEGIVNEPGAGVIPAPVSVITNAIAINEWELTDCYAMFLIYNTFDVTTQQLLLSDLSYQLRDVDTA